MRLLGSVRSLCIRSAAHAGPRGRNASEKRRADTLLVERMHSHKPTHPHLVERIPPTRAWLGLQPQRHVGFTAGTGAIRPGRPGLCRGSHVENGQAKKKKVKEPVPNDKRDGLPLP